MLHTYSFTYHPRYIMFLSQYFSFPPSVPFHQCSTLIFSYLLLLQKGKRAKPGNLPKAMLFRTSGSTGQKSTVTLFQASAGQQIDASHSVRCHDGRTLAVGVVQRHVTACLETRNVSSRGKTVKRSNGLGCCLLSALLFHEHTNANETWFVTIRNSP